MAVQAVAHATPPVQHAAPAKPAAQHAEAKPEAKPAPAANDHRGKVVDTKA